MPKKKKVEIVTDQKTNSDVKTQDKELESRVQELKDAYDNMLDELNHLHECHLEELKDTVYELELELRNPAQEPDLRVEDDPNSELDSEDVDPRWREDDLSSDRDETDPEETSDEYRGHLHDIEEEGAFDEVDQPNHSDTFHEHHHHHDVSGGWFGGFPSKKLFTGVVIVHCVDVVLWFSLGILIGKFLM